MVAPTATSTIVSQAFRFMEVTPPSSLADNSDKANDANEQYEVALRMCLEQEDFSFARRIVDLPAADLPSNETADQNLPYLYKMPSDLVKLRAVRDPFAKWRADERFLRSDQAAPFGIMYTRMVTNEKILPATFQVAVSYQLANLLAPMHVGSRTKRADLISDGATALQRSMINDAVSASHQRWDGLDDAGDWVCEVLR